MKMLAFLSVTLLASALLSGCATTPGIEQTARVDPYRPADHPRPVSLWLAGRNPVQPDTARANGVAATSSDATGTLQPAVGARRFLQRGDRIVIFLRPRGHGDIHKIEDVIEDTGAVTLPYIGPTRVTGMTAPEAEVFIRRRYAEEQIFQELDVTVIAQEEEYFVTGEVQRPGKFVYSRSITLLQAIAEAGGYTPFANASRVTVRRGETNVSYNARRIQDGRDPDPTILPGDVVIVSERGF